MRKFHKELGELSSLLDRWIAFLNNAEKLERHEVPPELATEPAIVKAIDRLDIMYFEAQEREIYEMEKKARLARHGPRNLGASGALSRRTPRSAYSKRLLRNL